ncbi:hypothetical protein O8W32_02500 [Methanomassiliicoccales archaeon LGM-DZ1]|nr:hypothetical protein O8W32_02500 [Methanomassiliicoccales archaeon LGM-DZ1]
MAEKKTEEIIAEHPTDRRIVKIANFRNLGTFQKGCEKPEADTLVLNRSVSREGIGGLVFLMGLNNAGKSNVLDAIKRCRDRKFEETDIPDFLDEKMNPNIEMYLADGAYLDIDEKTAAERIEEFWKSGKLYEKFTERLSSVENVTAEQCRKYISALIECVSEKPNSKNGGGSSGCKGRSIPVMFAAKLSKYIDTQISNYPYRDGYREHLEKITKMMRDYCAGRISDLCTATYELGEKVTGYRLEESLTNLKNRMDSNNYEDCSKISLSGEKDSFDMLCGLLIGKAVMDDSGTNVISRDVSQLADSLQKGFDAVDIVTLRVLADSVGECFDDCVFHFEEEWNDGFLKMLRNEPPDTRSFSDTLMTNAVSSKRFREKYRYIPSKNVYSYIEEMIDNSQLRSPGKMINPFFETMFSSIEIPESAISNLYSGEFSKGRAKSLEKRCNKKLEKISEEFNRMFCSDPKNRYAFEIGLETDYVYFYMNRGNTAMGSLNRQSRGFRWVFDFYVNFILRNELQPGDIVLMDEFGYGLNPQSTRELVKTLRRFASESGLTIVIATQNFMAVDIKHLDEVRLVINGPDGNTRILNNFEQFDHENHDVLKPLTDALTVGRNYLAEEGHTTVFVEGSSDYFFLTAFEEHFRSQGKDMNVDFIPINGLGARMDDYRKTIADISRIEKRPIILADGDKAGQSFKSLADGNEKAVVISLSEAAEDEKIIEIEDMFSSEDRKRLKVDLKNFDLNSEFAQNWETEVPKCSEETRARFEKVIGNVMLG